MKNFRSIDLALRDAQVIVDLSAPAFARLARQEKLPALYQSIVRAGHNIGTDNLWVLYCALPETLPGGVTRASVQLVNCTYSAFQELRTALNDQRVVAFLESSSFRAMPREDRLASLVAYGKETGLLTKLDNLSQVYSALPLQLSPSVARQDIQLVQLPFEAYNEFRTLLLTDPVQDFLASERFRSATSRTRLGLLRDYLADLTDAFRRIPPNRLFTALPATLSSADPEISFDKAELRP